MANKLEQPVVPAALIDTGLLTRVSPLPELSVWQARSTYAAIIAGAFIVANGLGFDPDGWLGRYGMSSGGLLDAFMVLMPLASGAWAWIERKTPNFQLVWWKS